MNFSAVSLPSLVVVVMSSMLSVSSQDHCDTVKNNCIANLGCGMALHTFYIACASLLSGEEKQCTTQCEKALISLVYAEDTVGKQFLNCTCSQGDKHCEEQKARIEVCDNVRQFNKSAIVKCSLAQLFCEADTSCLYALQYFQDHCSGLFRGEKCTSRCNNSLTILYQLASAQKILTCECDGTEDFKCLKIRRYTERLCFLKDDKQETSNTGTLLSTECQSLLTTICLVLIAFLLLQNDT